MKPKQSEKSMKTMQASLNEAMQVCHYGPGLGGVIHKVTGSFNGKCSVWYDNSGAITAACYYHWNNTRSAEHDVKPGGPIWREIEASTSAIRASQASG